MKYLITALLLWLFASCQQEPVNNPSSKDITIEDAKAHFLDATQNSALRDDSPINDFEVLWDLGEYREISLGDALSFPIEYQEDLVVSGTNGAIMSKSENMSIVFAYKVDGEIHVETVRKIPTKATEKFTGYMLVENIHGEVIRYLEFENGEFTLEFELVDGEENGRLVCTVTEYYTCTVRQGAADDCVLDKIVTTCVQEKTLAGVGVTPGGGDYGPSGPGDSNDAACEEENGYFADGAGNCVKECTAQQRTDGECPCPHGFEMTPSGCLEACDRGYVRDRFGQCNPREVPCPGNPVPAPEIAPQTNSGTKGGLFGCTRGGSGCSGDATKKYHGGIDLKSDFGDPVYAMYDGTASRFTQTDTSGNVTGAGYYVKITSNIDGKSVQSMYFHMQKKFRVSGTVAAGDIIGYLGTSGNLGSAIKDGYAESHVHVKIKENGVTKNPLDYLGTSIDQETGEVLNDPDCD